MVPLSPKSGPNPDNSSFGFSAQFLAENKRKTSGHYLGFVFCLMLALLSGCSSMVKPTSTGQNPHDIKPIVKPPAVVAAEPTWFGCQVDKDCIVEEGVCGEEQAVNKLYTTQFFSYRDEMTRTVDCINQATDDTLYSAKCVQHRCSLNPPPNTHPPKH